MPDRRSEDETKPSVKAWDTLCGMVKGSIGGLFEQVPDNVTCISDGIDGLWIIQKEHAIACPMVIFRRLPVWLNCAGLSLVQSIRLSPAALSVLPDKSHLSHFVWIARLIALYIQT